MNKVSFLHFACVFFQEWDFILIVLNLTLNRKKKKPKQTDRKKEIKKEKYEVKHYFVFKETLFELFFII